MKFIEEIEKLNNLLSTLNESLSAVTEKCRVAKLMGLTIDELEAELGIVGKIKPTAGELLIEFVKEQSND